MVGSRLEPGAAAVCFRLPVVFGTSRRYQQRRVDGLSMPVMRTQVGIVGAGPAGLVLSQLLDQAGIESVLLENRDRQYVTERVRAGVLEQGTADLLDSMGLGERMHREGIVHHGIYLRFRKETHH